VSEQELEQALLTAWMKLKLALEPTAVLPLAALMSGRLAPFGNPSEATALFLTGGNFDPALVARLLSR
jgi:threonine dehydratase